MFQGELRRLSDFVHLLVTSDTHTLQIFDKQLVRIIDKDFGGSYERDGRTPIPSRMILMSLEELVAMILTDRKRRKFFERSQTDNTDTEESEVTDA